MLVPRFVTLEFAAVVVAGIGGFVEVHIWSPAYTYYLLLVLVVLDVVTNNFLHNKRLIPRNLALRLAAYTVILAFAHGFAAHEPGLFFLSQLAMAPFVIVHMRRLIVSLGKLDLVDSEVADLLEKRITRRAELAAESAEAATMVSPPAEPAPVPEPAPEPAIPAAP